MILTRNFSPCSHSHIQYINQGTPPIKIKQARKSARIIKGNHIIQKRQEELLVLWCIGKVFVFE